MPFNEPESKEPTTITEKIFMLEKQNNLSVYPSLF